MSIPNAPLARLIKAHPHSAVLIKRFAGLVRAQLALAEESPPPSLPALDAASFSLGKSFIQAANIPVSDAFALAAAKKLLTAATRAFPERKEDFKALRVFLSKQKGEAAVLARLGLANKRKQIIAFAVEHGQQADTALFLAVQLAQTAATCAARAIPSPLPAWDKSHCPVCGSAPHASFIKDKEGNRFLQCGLCGHDWRFTRMACPACGETDAQKLPVTFLEGRPEQRAEGCSKCKTYLLCMDTRNAPLELPLALYLLGMTPLDLLMQEKGFAPVAE